MELFDIDKFSNNQNNMLNLPYINYKDIIYGNISRFKDFDKIDIADGLYYLDNHWQYILIKNNYLVLRIEFLNKSDLLPSVIWINEIDIANSIIKHYNLNLESDYKKKLICSIPIGISEQAYNFIDILFFSGYTIVEPYEFDIGKDTLGNNVIVLKNGYIIKHPL